MKQVGNATITMRDVAQVRDGFAVQTNIIFAERHARGVTYGAEVRQRLDADIIKRVGGAPAERHVPPALKITELLTSRCSSGRPLTAC